MHDLKNTRVSVILPISQSESTKINHSFSELSHNKINYDTSIDSECLSKPIISFTIEYFDRISWITDIIISCTNCVKEQIQEILNYDSEKLKFISPPNKHENSCIPNHDVIISLNRLLKFTLHYLKHGEQNDIVIVHDIKMPYIDENILSNLVLETLRNGVTCLTTSKFIEDNLLFKLNETNIEDIEIKEKSMAKPIRSFRSIFVDDYLNSKKYKIGYKPQAFQNSIFNMIFENCTDEDLDNDIDCLILAKKYTDVKAKLVFEENNISSFSNRLCCISHYLTENHKQVFISCNKFDQDICYLQNFLKSNNWNVELIQNLNKEAFLKMNNFLSNSNKPKMINIIKFCDELNELTDFNLASSDNNLIELDEKITVGCNLNNNEEGENIKKFNVLFIIKRENVNVLLNSNINDSIRNSIKQNINLANSWHATIFYDSLNKNMANLINYIFKDRNMSMIGQIFEFF